MTEIAPEVLERYKGPGLVVVDAARPADIKVAGQIAAELQRQYPGWHWGIDVNVRQGLIDIKLMDCNARVGYTIKVLGLFSWDTLRDSVMRAGGELLERFNMPRRRMDLDTWRSQPRGFTGLPEGDFS
jgi:hypothetical protein